MATTAGRLTAVPGSAEVVVQATEALYRKLFAITAGFALAMPILGLALAPFNRYDHHLARSLAIGAALSAAGSGTWIARDRLFYAARRRPSLLLGFALLGVAALWSDGGWRSSFYLASYAAICLAAVASTVRWTVALGALLATGYALGLVVNGYTWASLTALKDSDSVVANTAGYLVAAYFLAKPVDWLVGYVATVNQRLAALTATPPRLEPRPEVVEETPEPTEAVLVGSLPVPGTTDRLSNREREVALLIAEGYTNTQIAACLHVSEATVKSHVGKILRKLGVQNRGGVMSLVLHDRLLPSNPEPPAG